ncbi:RNA polymerase sigma-70 factor [Flavicella sp.]|uniref:RNA polymerase sigma factor n=1 Tax=Flavicella sp. TaxID=2957742 RepID=UPI0030196EEA
MKSNDLKILSRLKGADSSAYKELFDEFYKPLCVFSLKYSNSHELAEDVVQDFFIKFWDERLYMKLNGEIAPYLYSSIKNNTLQALKKEGRYRFEEIENQVNKLMSDENIDIRHIEQEKEKFHKAIEALPIKCREVFMAIGLGNQKYKEAALELGVSVNTVKTHYSRALKQLRNSLALLLNFIFF